MKLVVAVDKNWAIGYKGQLLVRIPDDMKQFRALTEGKVIILGRKTLATFPAGRPLENRVNVIVTAKGMPEYKNALQAGSVEEVLKLAEKYKSEDVFVVGGQSIYEQLLPYTDTAYVTYVDYAYEADTYFENLDRSDEWELVAESEEQTYFDVEYYFRKYKRKNQ